MRVEFSGGKYSCAFGTCLAVACTVPSLNGVAYPMFAVCASAEHLAKMERVLALTYEIQRLMNEEDEQQKETN